MNNNQIEKVLAGKAWIEETGNLYEYIGTDKETGKYIFSDVNDGYAILLTDKELQSNKIDFVEKF